MQSLDVISINLWDIIVSLANLVILYLLVKKFLYKPVKKMLENRQAAIEGDYAKANEARLQAEADKKAYEEKLSEAKTEADGVIQSAVSIAKARENEIIAEAKEKADAIVRKAEDNAALELKKAEESIKTEIVGVGTLLAEKLLEREISEKDNKELIDSFIAGIGEDDDAN